tara:strand:+ start:360 stop:740 length:381 start_codon:yes stop_codon:yes gene_type:complete
MSNQKNRERMAKNRRRSKKKVNISDFGRPAKIDLEPNPAFSPEAKSPVELEDIARMLSSPGAGSAASAGEAGKFYGTMLRESFPPRAGSAVKKSAAKAASMLKEGGMVGRATGQGYGKARRGGNLV